MDSRTNSCTLLLDVGGTFIKAGMASASGELIPGAEFSYPIHSEGSREDITTSLSASVWQGVCFALDNSLIISTIGISVPGPFDYQNGIPLMKHKFQSIYGLSLTEFFRSLPEVGPAMPICFMHDVNAAMLGEMSYGNAQGFANAAIVTLGTGLGFACCLDGKVQYSATGSPRIAIYNTPYRDGILEDYASKRGFLRLYEGISGRPSEPSLTVAELGRLAGEGDAAALETFATVAGILAESIRKILTEQRIECLLFGGQISRSFAFMGPVLREKLADLPHLERITTMRYIGEAAFYGLLAGVEQTDSKYLATESKMLQ